ncbi:hypothetical protein FA95DRAFT_1473299, partial [Auriscalpium vulgare]
LEVESDEARERRIQTILESLNSSNSTAAAGPTGPPSFDFGNRETFAVEPNAELLARLRLFLPQMEAANAQLQQQDARSIDIENVARGQPYVQMDLGLGVFEARRRDGSGED